VVPCQWLCVGANCCHSESGRRPGEESAVGSTRITNLPAGNIAIVAALDREISSLVNSWHPCVQQHSGHTFRFFESENAVAVCGGIGAEAARRAAEAIVALYSPALIYSAGFAGAADASLKIADIVIHRRPRRQQR